MIGFCPKIRSKLACESKKFKVSVYVIDPRELTLDRTRSIFGVEDEVTTDVLIGLKAGNRLEGAIPVVRVKRIGEE